MIFLSQVIDVLIAGDVKSIDYSMDVLQIPQIFLSEVIDVLIAGDVPHQAEERSRLERVLSLHGSSYENKPARESSPEETHEGMLGGGPAAPNWQPPLEVRKPETDARPPTIGKRCPTGTPEALARPSEDQADKSKSDRSPPH